MPSRLHVLTLATLFPGPTRPSFGIFVGRQTAGLAARPGVDVTVINPVGLPPFPLSRLPQQRALAKMPEQDEWHGLTVHRPRFLSMPLLPGLTPAAILRAILPLARKLHARTPFDLIDAEFFWPDGPAAMMLAKRLNVPFTIKARGFDIHHWASKPQSRRLIRRAADRAAALLSVSDALADDMGAIGIESAKIRTHYTGIDRALFHPRERLPLKAELGLDGPIISCVGALIPRKRQRLLIETMAHLPHVTLVLIGQGPDEQALRDLAEAAGVAERVRFAGALPHEEIARYLAASDIMALLSSAEGLANAWVEALASGTPVVAADVGGVRELIRSETAGHIVQSEPSVIANAARTILSHPPAQEDVAATVAHMSWEENARELETMFRDIAGK